MSHPTTLQRTTTTITTKPYTTEQLTTKATSTPVMNQLRKIFTARTSPQDLPSETLILDGHKIISKTASFRDHTVKTTQHYILNDNILKPIDLAHAAPVSLCRSPAVSDEQPVPLFELVHAPKDAGREEFSLAAAGEAALGNIALALPPDFMPALQQTPIYGLVSPSSKLFVTDDDDDDDDECGSADLLFTLLMSWADTIQYEIPDASGKNRFLASEDIVDDKKCLIIARTPPISVSGTRWWACGACGCGGRRCTRRRLQDALGERR